MRKKGHSSEILTLAEIVDSPSYPELNGTMYSILSRGGNGPADLCIIQTSFEVLSSALRNIFERGIEKLECTQVAGDRSKKRSQVKMLRSREATVFIAADSLLLFAVRLTEHRNCWCSQYFSGQSE